MITNHQPGNTITQGPDLHWPGRVLVLEDLRRNLNGHRRLLLSPTTVVTPLAAEHLRGAGVEVARPGREDQPSLAAVWGCAQDRGYPLVQSALQALQRENVRPKALPPAEDRLLCRWARELGECVARGECCGGVVFCQDPGLVSCVANKVPGLRAVAVVTIAQAARATLTLGANLLAVEMPGRTFFEVRQILRQVCVGGWRPCPDGVAGTLKELDGHAHR